MLEFTNKAFSRPNGRLFAYAPLFCAISALLSPLRCSRTKGTLHSSEAQRLELTQNSGAKFLLALLALWGYRAPYSELVSGGTVYGKD